MSSHNNVVRFKGMLPKGCEAWCCTEVNGIWYNLYMQHKDGKLIPWYVPWDCNAEGWRENLDMTNKKETNNGK